MIRLTEVDGEILYVRPEDVRRVKSANHPEIANGGSYVWLAPIRDGGQDRVLVQEAAVTIISRVEIAEQVCESSAPEASSAPAGL